MKTGWVVGVVAVSVLFCAGAAGGEGGRDRGDRARTFLVLRIAEALDLSDEKALEVSGIFKASSARRKELEAERTALAPGLRASIDAKDETQIQALVDKAREIDRKLVLLVPETFEKVESSLTVVQRGEFSLLLPEMRRQLRRGARRGRRMHGRMHDRGAGDPS